jgi:hypothetical protein
MCALSKGQAQAMRRHAALLVRQAEEQRVAYDKLREKAGHYPAWPVRAGLMEAARSTDDAVRNAEAYREQVARVLEINNGEGS